LYPFWKKVVEPALVAAAPTRVVEIGALRGDTTVRLLDLLGPESELHVIDPLPSFNPDDHSKRFPGRYIFHRDISHNVLPDLPAVDAALVDGDHNWFTVYHELRYLREAAERAGRPLPLIVMHDVWWPYGRRDLYYDPSRIPDSERQPYARRGLVPDGAISPTGEASTRILPMPWRKADRATGCAPHWTTSSPNTTARCESCCCRCTSASRSWPPRSCSTRVRNCAKCSTAWKATRGATS
jgi:hypothetical protein